MGAWEEGFEDSWQPVLKKPISMAVAQNRDGLRIHFLILWIVVQ
jgi:hypothetical protein